MNATPWNAMATSARALADATTIATTPPTSATITPSVIAWRTIRPGDAPSAARSAACPRSARASRRFARFADAMSNTSADVAKRILSDRPN
jgi:hypothetical protein